MRPGSPRGGGCRAGCSRLLRVSLHPGAAGRGSRFVEYYSTNVDFLSSLVEYISARVHKGIPGDLVSCRPFSGISPGRMSPQSSSPASPAPPTRIEAGFGILAPEGDHRAGLQRVSASGGVAGSGRRKTLRPENPNRPQTGEFSRHHPRAKEDHIYPPAEGPPV